MKQAEWIWYPDDFEIELSGKFMAERYERDIPIPPFWRLDSCYKNVKFKKIYELSAAETVKIEAEGSFNVMDETIKYWGAMIKEGATTFWERYDPEEKGAEKYAMYGRKYGKSLCHAWGATPLYIIGRYIVGLNFYKKISLADVAEYVGLSSGYLQKLFNRERQTSVIDYPIKTMTDILKLI